MKAFFKIIGGLLVIGIATLIGFGVAVGRGWIPTPQWLNDQLSQDAGQKVVLVPSTKLTRALPGRWRRKRNAKRFAIYIHGISQGAVHNSRGGPVS